MNHFPPSYLRLLMSNLLFSRSLKLKNNNFIFCNLKKRICILLCVCDLYSMMIYLIQTPFPTHIFYF